MMKKFAQNIDIKEYYSQRAREYESIYQKPERQHDLRKLEDYLSSVFAGRNVLEIACGTGYWTQFIAHSASSIFATDFNNDVITIAKIKDYQNCKITFQTEDAYQLAGVKLNLNAAFSGFWWSHIPKSRIEEFLKCLHSKLAKGAKIVFCDNLFVEGSSSPISRTDDLGNTYQMRKLNDGSEFEILKIFPSEEELRQTVAPFSKKIEYFQYKYFWLIEYAI